MAQAPRRRKPYQQNSVAKSVVDLFLSDGWEIDKSLKTRVRIRKPWTHDTLLENRVWNLFFLLGYLEIGGGRKFNITIKRKGADSYKKQVDVFAKDDETVVVAECKSSANVRSRSLQKDIEEFSSLKGPMANAIRKHYGKDFKPKILWFFFTSNIVWSKPDEVRAQGSNIKIVTEKELDYYLQIANHLRSAARSQFLAQFLENQKIPEMEGVSVPAVRGKIGGKTFFSFVSTPKQLLKIAFINHRSLNDPQGAPSYQRLVTRTRLNEISRFIHDGGYFPTNLLINFHAKCRFEQTSKDEDTNVVFGNLFLPAKYKSAWIIDGQHRLYGYASLEESYLSQNIMVVAFDRLKPHEEARLFVTINHKQKSVPKNLLDDLEGDLLWGSEKPNERVGAICARLIGRLNSEVGSALYGRVTRQGITPTARACLTVPSLKDGLRRSGLVGEAMMKNKEYSPGPLCGLSDEQTLRRAYGALVQYLGLLQQANTDQWDAGPEGYICTNTGLQGYLRLFGATIEYAENITGQTSREIKEDQLVAEVGTYLKPVLDWIAGASKVEIEKRFKVQFGSGGPTEYYFRLCSIVQERFPDYSPPGMTAWVLENSEEKISEADKKLKQLNILVQKYIFDKLKDQYGRGKEAYWHKGVPEKNIKTRAYDKSLDEDDENRLPLENYLSFLDYKKIVEHKSNWGDFKKVFDIPEPGTRGIAKNVRWMGRINELRRIPAHATEKRRYKTDDFDYIDYVYKQFMMRLPSDFAESAPPSTASQQVQSLANGRV